MIALFRSVARRGERPLDLLFVLELSKFLPLSIFSFLAGLLCCWTCQYVCRQLFQSFKITSDFYLNNKWPTRPPTTLSGNGTFKSRFISTVNVFLLKEERSYKILDMSAELNNYMYKVGC